MDRLLDRVDRLASSPMVAAKILELTQNPELEVRELVNWLEKDAALTAAMLRMVNSSYYGLTQKIASARHAVTYMGRHALRLAVLNFGVIDRLLRGAPAELCADFWRRTLTMACASSLLLADESEQRRDEAYCAGLMADIGVLVLAQLETTRYAGLYTEHPHGPELIAAEQQAFEFDHAALAGRMLGKWNFPAATVEAVARHHAETVEPGTLADVVHVASQLVDVLWTPQNPRLPEARTRLQQSFGLDLDGFITLANDCQKEVKRGAALFEVKLMGHIDCDALAEAARRQLFDTAAQAAVELDSMTAVFEQHSA